MLSENIGACSLKARGSLRRSSGRKEKKDNLTTALDKLDTIATRFSSGKKRFLSFGQYIADELEKLPDNSAYALINKIQNVVTHHMAEQSRNLQEQQHSQIHSHEHSSTSSAVDLTLNYNNYMDTQGKTFFYL